MASVFDEAFAAAGWAALQAQFGEAVTYTPAGGSGSSVTAVVHREEEREIDSGDGIWREVVCEVSVGTADVASPGLGDQVTFDGVDWAVVERLEQSGGVTRLRVARKSSETRSGRWRQRVGL